MAHRIQEGPGASTWLVPSSFQLGGGGVRSAIRSQFFAIFGNFPQSFRHCLLRVPLACVLSRGLYVYARIRIYVYFPYWAKLV